ncbi:unnamed protein product, partial [Mesorhabditis spiculigera]
MPKIRNLCTCEGFLNVLQVCLSLAAIIGSSVIWNDGNVALFIYYSGYGWQILINVILIATFIFSCFLLILNVLGGNNLLETIGKPKALSSYALIFLLLIVAGGLETWYATLASSEPSGAYWNWAGIYRPRFIATAVFTWLTWLTYAILLGLNFMY